MTFSKDPAITDRFTVGCPFFTDWLDSDVGEKVLFMRHSYSNMKGYQQMFRERKQKLIFVRFEPTLSAIKTDILNQLDQKNTLSLIERQRELSLSLILQWRLIEDYQM